MDTSHLSDKVTSIMEINFEQGWEVELKFRLGMFSKYLLCSFAYLIGFILYRLTQIWRQLGNVFVDPQIRILIEISEMKPPRILCSVYVLYAMDA